MEQILYEDTQVTITNRKITFREQSVYLATIRAIEIRQIKEPERELKVVIYGFSWSLLCMIPSCFVEDLSGISFFFAGVGYMLFASTMWPYAVVAKLQQGEKVVFSAYRKHSAKKIAQILADELGVKIHMK